MTMQIFLLAMLPLCILGQKWSYSTSEGSWYIYAATCPNYDSLRTKGNLVFSKTATRDDPFYPSGAAHSANAGKSCMELASDHFGQSANLRGVRFTEPGNCTVFFDDGHVGSDIAQPSKGVWFSDTTSTGTGAWNPSAGDGNWSYSGTCYGFAGRTCGNKDGTGAAVTCKSGFSTKVASTSCKTCANDGTECCIGKFILAITTCLLRDLSLTNATCPHICDSQDLHGHRWSAWCGHLRLGFRSQGWCRALHDLCQQRARMLLVRF